MQRAHRRVEAAGGGAHKGHVLVEECTRCKRRRAGGARLSFGLGTLTVLGGALLGGQSHQVLRSQLFSHLI